jgi:hypothetical protein
MSKKIGATKREIRIETSWTYTDKPSPQFARLMNLLLNGREHGNEQGTGKTAKG